MAERAGGGGSGSELPGGGAPPDKLPAGQETAASSSDVRLDESAPAPTPWGSRSVDCFERVEQVGEGTYGQVYKARNKETGEIVALKRVRMDNEKEGFPVTAIREIKILKLLNHKNIVRLQEIVTSKASEYNHGKGSIYMVMEYSDHDLTGLTDCGQRFSLPQIKCYMKQLLEGIAYCHKNKVLHRDIKGSNLLINNEGQLKLADFGLARPYENNDQKPRMYTNRVITLWYRPPELLLGAHFYGTAIDMWSAGCILAELLVRKPILPGRNEFEQLELIFKLLGTPSEDTWPGVTKLQYYDMIMGQQRSKFQSRFHEKFGQLDKKAQDLLSKLLCMDPTKRISALDALDHDFFWTEPLPSKPEHLPKYPPSHEFTAKKRRQAAQQQGAAHGAPPPQQQPGAHFPPGAQGAGAQHGHMYGQPAHGQGYYPPVYGQQHWRGPVHPPFPGGGEPPAKRYRDEAGGYNQPRAGGPQHMGMPRQQPPPYRGGQMMPQGGRGHPPHHHQNKAHAPPDYRRMR